MSSLNEQLQQRPVQYVMRPEPKNPWLAFLLGILIAGAGLMYVGRWGAGIAFLLISVLISVLTFGFAAPLFWLISAIWGYTAAKGYNRKLGY